jgi:hypothetical protein
MSLRWSSIGLAICLISLAGCAELQQAKIDARNRYLSNQAWIDLEDTYCDMNFDKDFGRGFREGYYDVASGGDGCPPILPPQRYWSVRYMNTEGRARTQAWFEGYRYGALVAEQDGVGVFIELPTSLPDSPKNETPRPNLDDLDEESVPSESAPADEDPEQPVGEDVDAESENAGDDDAPEDEMNAPANPAEGLPAPELPAEAPNVPEPQN